MPPEVLEECFSRSNPSYFDDHYIKCITSISLVSFAVYICSLSQKRQVHMYSLCEQSSEEHLVTYSSPGCHRARMHHTVSTLCWRRQGARFSVTSICIPTTVERKFCIFATQCPFFGCRSLRADFDRCTCSCVFHAIACCRALAADRSHSRG